MAPDTYYLWAQRVNAAPSLAALDTVATGLRQLREDEDQAHIFLLCTLRRLGLYDARAPHRGRYYEWVGSGLQRTEADTPIPGDCSAKMI